MERHAHLSCRAVLTAAQARGWITLEELLQCAATSPVQPEELTSLAHEAGIELVEGEAGEEEAWEKVGMLAEKGPSALVTVPPAPPEEEELAPGSPAALYLQEISKTPLLTAEEEITLAQQLEAGEAAKRQLAKGVADAATRARLEAAVQAGRPRAAASSRPTSASWLPSRGGTWAGGSLSSISCKRAISVCNAR